MKTKKSTRRSPKRRRFKNQTRKRHYRTRNWKEYNAALVTRGSLTLWIEASVLASWLNQERTGQRGASPTYSEVAIETALSLKVVYHLSLRGAQGFLASVLQLMAMNHLPVPNYSTLSRRQKTLMVALPRAPRGHALHLVVDSTGCKIYGEGEWKVRQHGVSKRRTWRKLHLGVDEATGQIAAAVLTTNDVADSAVLPDLLAQVPEPIAQVPEPIAQVPEPIAQVPEPIAQVSGDGSYDQRTCYDTLAQRQAEQGEPLQVTIPPRRGARIWQHGNSPAPPQVRDENLRRVRQIGRQRWKEESGYHRRSLAETAMFRYKSRFGDKLWARGFDSQATEAFIRCAALNKMTQLGMPESYAV